jgi:hypothetical protein
MSIDLKPEQQRMIDLAIQSGAYHDPEDCGHHPHCTPAGGVLTMTESPGTALTAPAGASMPTIRLGAAVQ